MRHGPVRLALATLAAGWLWAGLLAIPHDAAAAEKVVVAITSPQSGPQAAWGTELIRGAELALAEYDPKKLKFTYEILPMDDTADPKVGITIANKLKVDKDVMAVIGPWNSGVAIPASPIYSEAKLPLFAIASDPKLTRQGFTNIFRTVSTNDFQAIGAEAYLVGELKKKRIAIIHDNTIPGVTMAEMLQDLLKKDGAEAVMVQGVSWGERDWSPVLTTVKQKNPDAIYLGTVFGDAALALKQMKDLGIKIPALGPDGMYSDDLVKLAGPAAEGACATALGADVNKLPTASKFVNAFKAKYKESPQQYSVFAYEDMHIIIKAVEKAGKKDRAEILKAVRQVTPYEGALGKTVFNERGDTVNQVIGIYCVKDGKWEYLKTAKIPADRLPK
jgi:branched-chain amino acid transport system substrate-binding protein